MLKSIEIRNFKAIQDKDGVERPLKLNDLAKVNYLVGPNGCGKSSVIEILQTLSNNCLVLNLPEIDESCDKVMQRRYMSNSDKLKALSKNNNFTCKLNWTNNKEENIIYPNKLNNSIESIKIVNFDFPLFLKYYHKYIQSVCKCKDPLYGGGLDFFKAFESSLEKRIGENNEIFIHEKQSDYVDYVSDIFNESFHHEFGSSEGYQHIPQIFQTLGYYKDDYNIICIENIDFYIHPKLQKEIPHFLNKALNGCNTQVFISTHSPFIINSAVDIAEKEIKEDREPSQKVYRLENGTCPNPEGFPNKNQSITNHYDGVLSGLGVQPSDLLFANGVIWVEGPLDAMYIEKWLDLYQKHHENEVGFKIYKKGLGYSIQVLATAIWGYTVVEDYETESNDGLFEKPDEIIKLFELNRRNFVIIDSDTDIDKDKKPEDEGFIKTGNKVHHNRGDNKKKLLESIKGKKSNFWITDGTIENYLYQKFVQKSGKGCKYFKDFTNKFGEDKKQIDYYFCKNSKKKTEIAKAIFKNKDLKFSDFCENESDLYKKIEHLYNTIQSWNQ